MSRCGVKETDDTYGVAAALPRHRHTCQQFGFCVYAVQAARCCSLGSVLFRYNITTDVADCTGVYAYWIWHKTRAHFWWETSCIDERTIAELAGLRLLCVVGVVGKKEEEAHHFIPTSYMHPLAQCYTMTVSNRAALESNWNLKLTILYRMLDMSKRIDVNGSMGERYQYAFKGRTDITCDFCFVDV